MSVLAAGFLLSRRRRRYRAISATASSQSSSRDHSGRGHLTRSSTFGQGTEDGEIHHNRRLTPKHNTSEDATCNHLTAALIFNSLSGVSELSVVGDGSGSRPGVSGSGEVGGATLEDVDCERLSISSSGSFHSTLESLEDTHVS